MVQTVFALAIVYGLTLMMGSLTTSQAEQLSAGVWQLGLVAVGVHYCSAAIIGIHFRRIT